MHHVALTVPVLEAVISSEVFTPLLARVSLQGSARTIELAHAARQVYEVQVDIARMPRAYEFLARIAPQIATPKRWDEPEYHAEAAKERGLAEFLDIPAILQQFTSYDIRRAFGANLVARSNAAAYWHPFYSPYFPNGPWRRTGQVDDCRITFNAPVTARMKLSARQVTKSFHDAVKELSVLHAYKLTTMTLYYSEPG